MFHLDKGRILKHEMTPEGFLNCYMRIAKVGELKYFNSDGSERIEVVTPEVLFDKESMDSFKGKLITNEHPPEPINSKNARQYQRGLSSPYVVIDGDFLGIVATITDEETIQDIVSGNRREVSCGYWSKTKLRSDGKFEQVKRLGNHIAITRRGRAGSEVRVKLDSLEEVWESEDFEIDNIFDETAVKTAFDSIKANRIEKNIKTQMKRSFQLDGIGYETEDTALAEAVVKLSGQAETLRKDNASYLNEIENLKSQITEFSNDASKKKGQYDALIAERDSMALKMKALEEKITAMEAEDKEDSADEVAQIDIEKEIQSRLDTWDQVSEFLKGKDPNFKPNFKLDSLAIRRLYLSAKYPELKIDSADENYINGSFEIAILSESQTVATTEQPSKVDEILTGINENRQDSAKDENSLMTAIASYTQNLDSAWKAGAK